MSVPTPESLDALLMLMLDSVEPFLRFFSGEFELFFFAATSAFILLAILPFLWANLLVVSSID